MCARYCEWASGGQCSQNIDDCSSFPYTAHSCVDIASFVCVCASGYSGAQCSVNIDDCASARLRQRDVHRRRGFVLLPMLNGYSGSQCSINIDECASSRVLERRHLRERRHRLLLVRVCAWLLGFRVHQRPTTGRALLEWRHLLRSASQPTCTC
jgi:hypothetical protein